MKSEEKSCVICKKAATTGIYHDNKHFPCCEPCREEHLTNRAMQTMRPIVEKLFDEINGGDYFTAKAFVESVMRQHRTLQQGFAKLICGLIRFYAGLTEAQYDLRNEATVHLYRELMPVINRHPLPFI